MSDAPGGKLWWRSLEEAADGPELAALLARQYPSQAEAWIDPLRRRDFLRLMAASLALGGLASCSSQPREEIVPYVHAPENLVPGKPLFYATALALGGLGTGVLVESHLGRPTKVEGNPLHPASLGATDVFAQAAVLGLYDPDRSQALTYVGAIRPWSEFLAVLRSARGVARARRGAGLRILTETVTSPTLAAELAAVLHDFPEARWHQWEPAGRDTARAGARLAFGEDADTRYALADADVIVALDADFLGCGPAHLRSVREFAARRRPDGRGMNRLYVVESGLTPTGARADHRLPCRAGEVEDVARALAAALGVAGAGGAPPAADARWVAAVARDLAAHRGRSAVIPGEQQPAVVHALAHAINAALGNVGKTVVHTAPVEARPEDQLASLRALTADMDAGRVELLLVLGGNPVYTAPADVPFAAALAKVPLRVHLGLYADETAELCHWHVPEAHPLEAWGDVRAYDGTVTIQQPLIAPLYGGRSALELLAAFGERPERGGREIVREHWQGARPGADFEAAWRRWLHDGVVPGTALAPKTVAVRPDVLRAAPRAAGAGLEVVFRPDPTLHDGRFANNAWLEELPKPITSVTWDNPVLLGPAAAERLGVASEDEVELEHGGRKVRAPVFVVPGHADGSLTVLLGHGRRRAGRVGTGVGFDAYRLRTADAPWIADGVTLRRTGRRRPLATVQHHHRMEGRDVVRTLTVGEHEAHAEPEVSLYPSVAYPGHRWGMAIDLSTCVGCNACVVACQAENNVPVVGRTEVLRGREMHWLRVDSYHAGESANPETHFMPVPCMQCENAPCEVVCPVEATVHSAEGLNDMVYNRCVGTRYCSNNCAYKVRRFNFFQYADWETESLVALRNPDVSVRSRGVMEKCTYCVQRITHARIRAEEESRPIRDGELVTACQQACPAEAIVFGDLNDPQSRVVKLKAEARSYALLEELNTRPRTTYLAAVKNPNPELAT